MNREQLTQIIRGAFSPDDMLRRIEEATDSWQLDMQNALLRAIGPVAVRRPSTFQERWEAIRFAVEQQSRELRDLKAGASVDIDGLRASQKEKDREQLAEALQVSANWSELLTFVRELRESAPGPDLRHHLSRALGLGNAGWPVILANGRALVADTIGCGYRSWAGIIEAAEGLKATADKAKEPLKNAEILREEGRQEKLKDCLRSMSDSLGFATPDAQGWGDLVSRADFLRKFYDSPAQSVENSKAQQRDVDANELGRALKVSDLSRWDWPALLRIVQAQADVVDERRAELAKALGLTRDELVQEGWQDLLERVSKLRTSEKHIEQRACERQREEDASQLGDAMGMIQANWREMIVQARLRATYVDRDAPARQRSEDAAELREALELPESSKWHELIIVARSRALDVRLTRLRNALSLPASADWHTALTRVERWRDRYAELLLAVYGSRAGTQSMNEVLITILDRGGMLRTVLKMPEASLGDCLLRVADLASLAKAIEAVAHPWFTMPGVGTAMAAGPADSPIDRGDFVSAKNRE